MPTLNTPAEPILIVVEASPRNASRVGLIVNTMRREAIGLMVNTTMREVVGLIVIPIIAVGLRIRALLHLNRGRGLGARIVGNADTAIIAGIDVTLGREGAGNALR